MTRSESDETPAPRGRVPGAEADGYNAGYAEQLYERALRERGVVPPSLAEWLENGGRLARERARVGRVPVRAERAAPETPARRLRLAAIAGTLVEAYRDYGHLAVQLDPLGDPPPGHPMLDPDFYGVSREELSDLPAAAVGTERLGRRLGEVLDRLETVYCGRIGYEIDHVEDPDQRQWLIDYIESGRHLEPMEPEEARRLLERLTRVEGLERFLHRSYLGKKRFSIEGLDMMVPMLDEVLGRSAGLGTRKVFLGMAHRGRLNVLAHIIGLDYEAILAEFEEVVSRGMQSSLPETGSGDVKYHVGSQGTVRADGIEVRVHLSPNPSHLEHVDPVVEGMARAARDGAEAAVETVLPVLIHGDASFLGQGVVAETLNLSRLEAYETGGTIHLIANNQLGFTTPPEEGRSTRYASDLALGFRIPVVHVNADDPEACLGAARLAVDYRFRFGEDLVIDLVGYRRYGHNEGDEPGYTQPGMYERISEHPSVRALWAERLAADGVASDEEAAGMEEEIAERLARAREEIQAAREEGEGPEAGASPEGSGGGDGGSGSSEDGASALADGEESTPGGLTRIEEEDDEPATGVDEERLRRLNEEVHSWPEDFRLFRKLGRQMEKRRESLGEGLDWAHAEALAFASLVTDGIAVRLTGEDSERGTFSQRHLVLHEETGDRTYVPLRHLGEDQARFEVWNSPLSEVATLGFEYGYSTVAIDALVLWEAQFGDFVNVGQAIIDQFIVAGRSKWGQESRLSLLLPHGYEGQGPEHSSARLERFLQLAAESNIRVANPSTPAQYFHLLRLQAIRHARRPLVVMTPKSLLRHPRARSPLGELAGGRFRPVLQDADAAARGEEVRRVVLCTGKVYYDLTGSEAREEADDVAVVRVERLYPFPASGVEAALEAFPETAELLWVQEEPSNMGAWSFVRPWLRAIAGGERVVRYAGRPERASPAEGWSRRHQARQGRIVEEALTASE